MADNKDKKVLNVPALRFPEFTGEWKEERLDEIAELSKGVGISKVAELSKGVGISKEQLSEDGEPCILYGELYTKYKSEIIHKVISKTNIESSNLKHSKRNDVIIPCSGETAIDIAVARCVPFDNILLGGDLNIIRLHKDDGAFMAYQLNGKRKIDIAKLAQGVSVVHLYGDNIKAIKTYNPCLQEQQKIVKLLSMLDERMELQNKIIEDLRLLRDAIMVEHYRKCNKSELYIYDIGEPFNVMNLSKDDLTKDGSPCIIYGELFTTYGCVIENVVSHTTKSPNSTLSTKGDLLFPASTTVDALSLIAPSSINEDGIILGGDMFGIHVNEQYNSNYLSYYFNIIGKKNLAKYAKGSTIIHLHYADIQKAKITLPNKNEQETVANLLLKVEHKLNIEQKMLINYLNTKNFLLRQMFI